MILLNFGDLRWSNNFLEVLKIKVYKYGVKHNFFNESISSLIVKYLVEFLGETELNRCLENLMLTMSGYQSLNYLNWTICTKSKHLSNVCNATIGSKHRMSYLVEQLVEPVGLKSKRIINDVVISLYIWDIFHTLPWIKKTKMKISSYEV